MIPVIASTARRRAGVTIAPNGFVLGTFAPVAMASPPAVTAAALTDPSLLGEDAVRVESWAPAIRHLGNLSWETTTSWSAGAVMTNVIDISGRTEAWSVEFKHRGSRMGLRFTSAGASTNRAFRVYVDGEAATDYTYPSANTQYALDFGSESVRTIRVDMCGVGWAGLDLDPGDGIAPTAERAKLYILGDSWVEGDARDSLGADCADLFHMAFLTGRLLDASCFIGGISGTGYSGSEPTGYGSTYRRLHIVQSGALCVLPFGSINDGAGGSELVGTNAAALFSHLAVNLPSAKLVVVGPQSYCSRATTDSSPYLKAAALAAPNVAAYADPQADDWVTGTGHSVTPAGDGTADLYHNGYNTSHLTVAGNRFYAETLAALVAATVPA